ncbi:MAG TPA: purine-nucleoside phosphorylase [Hellea balneolensis]|uniref:Purine nucleoside phosphorylase n=1 Tax=Hellea balneolensis TaxID=287478 RepID=A0A7C5R1H3_9PROT|nr:purine-nucleoside phosphorylase [Hellea balneolensis]
MSAEHLAAHIRKKIGDRPIDMGLVLGSGLSGFVEAVEDAVIIPYAQLPGFPGAGVSGHNPNLVIGRVEGVSVAVFGGRAHYYEHGEADIMRLPMETLKALGAHAVLLTNSAGSLRDDIPPGAQMLITDHLNLSGTNPLIGEQGDARFVDMGEAYDLQLCQMVRMGAEAIGAPIKQGVYAWFSGPSFETPAEVKMAGVLGADAVGMSTVPEVILARFLGLKCVGISNITNMGAGLSQTAITHEQTKAVAGAAAQGFEALLRAFLREYAKAQ